MPIPGFCSNLGPALAEPARDAALEDTELGARVEAELAEHQVPLGLEG